MPLLAADDQRVSAAAGQRLAQGPGWIKAFSPLVEGRHLYIGAQPNPPGIGRERPAQDIDERGLAGAVGTDDSDPIAAHDANREIVDDRPRSERFADLVRLDHQRT